MKLPPQAEQTKRPPPHGVRDALHGIGVVITRPRDSAARLLQEIERQGGTAWPFAALEIDGIELDATLQFALAHAPGFDFWIFISQSAVEHGVRLLRQAAVKLDSVPAIAIGPSTQRALLDAGFGNVLVSENGFDSDALLALPALQRGAAAGVPRKVLIFRGRGGRERLREGLQARGFAVAYLECYQRRAPQSNPEALLEAWRSGKVHAISVMSVQTLQNFIAVIGAAGRALASSTPVFVPHERIAAAAHAEGMREVIVTGIGDEALLASFSAYFGARHDAQQ